MPQASGGGTPWRRLGGTVAAGGRGASSCTPIRRTLPRGVHGAHAAEGRVGRIHAVPLHVHRIDQVILRYDRFCSASQERERNISKMELKRAPWTKTGSMSNFLYRQLDRRDRQRSRRHPCWVSVNNKRKHNHSEVSRVTTEKFWLPVTRLCHQFNVIFSHHCLVGRQRQLSLPSRCSLNTTKAGRLCSYCSPSVFVSKTCNLKGRKKSRTTGRGQLAG